MNDVGYILCSYFSQMAEKDGARVSIKYVNHNDTSASLDELVFSRQQLPNNQFTNYTFDACFDTDNQNRHWFNWQIQLLHNARRRVRVNVNNYIYELQMFQVDEEEVTGEAGTHIISRITVNLCITYKGRLIK